MYIGKNQNPGRDQTNAQASKDAAALLGITPRLAVCEKQRKVGFSRVRLRINETLEEEPRLSWGGGPGCDPPCPGGTFAGMHIWEFTRSKGFSSSFIPVFRRGHAAGKGWSVGFTYTRKPTAHR